MMMPKARASRVPRRVPWYPGYPGTNGYTAHLRVSLSSGSEPESHAPAGAGPGAERHWHWQPPASPPQGLPPLSDSDGECP
eukprot:1462178-Rhodomonas_salina.2